LKDLSQFETFITQECGEFDFSIIDNDLIRVWISQLVESGLSHRSVNRKLSSLKSFFKYLKRMGVIEQNPAEKVSAPKIAKKLPTFANDKELGKVLDDALAYSDDFRGHRDQFIIELLYLTGIRRAELIALKDSDIDFSTCTLRVTGKRNKQRIIPFSDATKAKFQQYIESRDAEVAEKSPFFFVRENGEPLYPRLVYDIVNRQLSNISTLSKKSPHTLRHSFATEMLNNGAEINVVKEILGHSSLASTEVYTHVTFDELKRVYQNAHPRAK
jgi:integrase/recombinase XerC